MPLAKHLGIRDWIESRISDGTYSAGDRLPTEKELIEKFAVSRNPVQRAMEGLVADGLVVRRRGLGTTVARTGLRTRLIDQLDPDAQRGVLAGFYDVLATRVAGSDDFALSQHLITPGTPCAKMHRLKRSPAGAPLVLEHSVVSLTYAPALLDADLTAIATTDYYRTHELALHRVESDFHAVHLTAEQSATLSLAADRPVIKQLRRIYSAAQTCIEASELYYHPHHLILEVSCRVHD